MKKLIIVAFAIFLFSVQTAEAALVTRRTNGEMRTNVLGINDALESHIEDVVTGIGDKIASVRINVENDSLVLSFAEKKDSILSLENFDGEVYKIESKHEPDSFFVLKKDTSYFLSQGEYMVRAEDVISVTDNKKIIISTSSGEHTLFVLPSEAITPMVQSQVVDQIDTDNVILKELPEGELVYEISAQKHHKIFNVFTLDANIIAQISAKTGILLHSDQPTWSRVLSAFEG